MYSACIYLSRHVRDLLAHKQANVSQCLIPGHQRQFHALGGVASWSLSQVILASWSSHAIGGCTSQLPK